MLRRTPLVRKTRLRPIRKTRRRSGRVRDPAYLAWLHTLPCYAATTWRAKLWEDAMAIANPEHRAAAMEDLRALAPLFMCDGEPTADHVGRRPYGRKSNDRESIALCFGHHMQRQRARGLWKGYAAPAMRAFSDEAVGWHLALYAQHQEPDHDLPF